MCGFSGFWDQRISRPSYDSRAIIEKMAEEIAFRGPDGRGFWTDDSVGVALGHVRLSILELSPLGAQPMRSFSGRYWLVYNGEVYNAPALREELIRQDGQFKGTSDTEVLLAGIEIWGLKKTLEKSIGMFAFALWDSEDRTITLARDRLGVKPLYYGQINGVWFFGSQPRSFRPHPSWEGKVNPYARSAFFAYNYIPEDYCIYQGIGKVKPGGIVTITAQGTEKISEYWSLNAVSKAAKGQSERSKSLQTDPTFVSEQIESCEALLQSSIDMRQLSDVPLGAFLSGGIDSSLVVALMQKHSSMPIKTFSIGFEEASYDEAPFAAQIARLLKTDHYEHYMSPSDALDIIPSLPEYFDEPFADSSQIPTFLVAGMAKQHVTVSLSGDGGDELFGGYTRYLLASKLERILDFVPPSSRKGLSSLLAFASRPFFESVIGSLGFGTHLSHKLHKLSLLLKKGSLQEVYESLLIHWQPEEIERFSGVVAQCPQAFSDAFEAPFDFTEAMTRADLGLYLPSDILVKVDRASMAHGLEAREPLLDHRLLEFALSLPPALKIQNGVGKWILRQVLERYVPRSFFDRPKQGFGLPIDRWLREGLREWGESLLSIQALETSGLKDPHFIREKWQQHQSRKHNFAYPLWGILMYQAWYGRYIGSL